MFISPNNLKIKCKIQNHINFKHKFYSSQTYLLSSSSARVILIASILWFAQENHLKAMEPEEYFQQTHHISTRFYEDDSHPLTQEFWRKRDLSKRMLELKKCIDPIKDDIIHHRKDLTQLIGKHLEEYKYILQCTSCTHLPIVDLNDIHLDAPSLDAAIDRGQARRPKGWSKANVIIFPKRNNFSEPSEEGPHLIAIKKFDDIAAGLKELIESLIVLERNPAPEKLKMARIYDAVICPQNSLSIIMEAVGTHDIHTYLSTEGEGPISAVKACGEYFATFHIENHSKLNKINRNKYLKHVAQFYNSLLQDTLEEEDAKYKLLTLNPKEKLSDNTKIQSHNVLLLLEEGKRKEIENLIKTSCDLLRKNTETIFQIINSSKKLIVKEHYFLTRNHGDAHIHNLFYYASRLTQNDELIPTDSLQRVSMIDFATLINTADHIGDPAEDIGRFLAALRNWWVLATDKDMIKDEKVKLFQDEFLSCYLSKIKNSNIIEESQQKQFEKVFKEHTNFYKLRYYRAIFNVQKDEDPTIDRKIKKKLLESWIEENSDLKHISSQLKYIRKESTERKWEESREKRKGITHWLPNRSIEFIESAAEEDNNKSYLTTLWEMLQVKGTATLSSQIAIAGMGGIGKTTLALEYAYEALENNAYDLIYWIYSNSEDSLLKSYRDLLEAKGISTQNKDPITLLKQKVPEMGRCLLIYDNVPDQSFLQKKLPDNVHILMTSRSRDKWDYPLYLDVFRPSDSLQYLFQVTGLERTEENEKIAGNLAESLGHLPLALAHAAHYIKLVGGQKVTAKTFETYLNKVDPEFEKRINRFTEKKSKVTYENLIRTTVRIAKEYLENNGILPVANDLLTYSAYLDSDSIAEEIFLEYWPNPEEDKKKIKKVIEQLSALSLIRNIKLKDSFSIHQLVQLVIRNEIESKENDQTSNIFSKIVPMFNYLFEKNTDASEKIGKLLDNKIMHFSKLFRHSRRLKIESDQVDNLEGILKILFHLTIGVSQKSLPYIGFQNLTKTEVVDQITAKLPQWMNKKTDAAPFHELIKNDDFPNWLIQIGERSHPKIQMTISEIYATDKLVKMNTKKSFLWCKKAAKQGYAEALEMLAFLNFGPEVEKTDIKKQKWIIKAAHQGSIIAQTMFGLMTDNDREGIYWLKKAADEGHPYALYRLGVHYAHGREVQQDDAEAIDLFIKAEDYAESQYYLGVMFANGRGIQKDDREAFHWITRAAKWVRAPAFFKFRLGMMCLNGLGTEQNITEGINRLTEAANQGCVLAQIKLGSLYRFAQEVERDEEKAQEWETLATKSEDIYNMHLLGETTKHDTEAIQWIIQLAEQGYGYLQYWLGKMYANSQEVDLALAWFTKAAESKYAEAQYKLGLVYLDGFLSVEENYVEKNYKKAVTYFRDAADQSHATALFNLGVIYSKGLSDIVIKDLDEARRYYLLAASLGHADAQNNLGNMYKNEQKYKEAVKFYKMAVKQNNINAQFNFAMLHDIGQGVERNIDKKIKYLKKAANQGYAKAQYNLGLIYQDGLEVPKDGKMAEKFYIMAANQGYADAQYNLGLIYQDGLEVPKDEKMAEQFYIMAADQGHINALLNLGNIYSNIQNYEKALTCYSTATEKGSPLAPFNLALMYENGEGVNQNYEKAINNYNIAAERGNARAQHKLGGIYFFGLLGVNKNYDKAVTYFTLAASQGYKEALVVLDCLKNEKSATNSIQQIPENKKQNESKNIHVLQGGYEKYLPSSATSFTVTTSTTTTTTTMGIYSSQPAIVASQWIDSQGKEVSPTTQPQPQFFPDREEKTENSTNMLLYDFENKDQYAIQGNDYISAALQHAEDGNTVLAQHLEELANEKYQISEDAKLAKNLQKEGAIESRL